MHDHLFWGNWHFVCKNITVTTYTLPSDSAICVCTFPVCFFFLSFLFSFVCVWALVPLLLVCPIQCSLTRTTKWKRDFTSMQIFPNDIHFYFEHSSIDIFFSCLFRWGIACCCFSISCYFHTFEISGSLLAVDFIGINATNESTQVYKVYTIHKDAWIISIFSVSIFPGFRSLLVDHSLSAFFSLSDDIAVKHWHIEANCGGTKKKEPATD